jgi:type I restriction enzyme, R subunit
VLGTLQKLVNAEKSDLFDVLEYVSFAVKPITREMRVAQAQGNIFKGLDNKQKAFLEFVLSKYIESGVEELDQEKLPELLTLKYHALGDAREALGSVENIRSTFIDFQKHLYEKTAA